MDGGRAEDHASRPDIVNTLLLPWYCVRSISAFTDGILSLEALFPAVITMSLLIIFNLIPITAADNSSH